MAADPLRGALSRAVTACRRILLGDRGQDWGEVGEQLKAPFGFDPYSGEPSPIEGLDHLRSDQVGPAALLRDWHAHLAASAPGSSPAEKIRAAYEQMKQEIGFTILHRLCALRMAEERGFLRECVGRHLQSEAFQVWHRLAGGATLGAPGEAYAVFLARQYDELALDLPVVFDRRSPASLVAPSPPALERLLTEINAGDLGPLWHDETTLGWIFEDWNDPDERAQMRAHDAPRNLRELAVRNQFFTPRWVVEFLTDNALGRTWVERTAGRSRLTETCPWMLAPEIAQGAEPGDTDPRALKVLDPACGSGHFLLYAFSVLQAIYREAWEQGWPAAAPLRVAFPDRAVFEAEIPRLILEHNLYGVDIDPRCIQEAALSLWLRAQRAWGEQGLRGRQRPRIARVNLFCSQALSGDATLRQQLLGRLQPALLGRLVEAFLARSGEMGLLQREETALQDVVATARREYRAWEMGGRYQQVPLHDAPSGARQGSEFREVADDERFWAEAEGRLRAALGSLTEQAGIRDHFRTRLFAEDVRNGMEFFDLCRMRFDVVLMNPPFGEPSEGTKAALDEAYPNAGHDLYAMFYERMLEMLAPRGRVGAITNRTWLGRDEMEGLRRKLRGEVGAIEVAADLGSFVLNAAVETIAAVSVKDANPDVTGTWFRLLKTSNKALSLSSAILSHGKAVREGNTYEIAAEEFRALPKGVFGYWMSQRLRAVLQQPAISPTFGTAFRGTDTGLDARFLRLSWEVYPSPSRWPRFAKGGEYSPYYDDVHLVIHWDDDGRQVRGFPKSYPRSRDQFWQRGTTWPLRTTKPFGPRALPAQCAFSGVGPAFFGRSGVPDSLCLAVLSARPIDLFISVRLGAGDDRPGSAAKLYLTGIVNELPYPEIGDTDRKLLSALASEAVEIVRLGQIEEDTTGETVVAFAVPPVLLPLPDGRRPATFDEAVRARVAAREDRLARLAEIQAEIDRIVADAYGFSPRDRQVMDEELEAPLATLPGTDPLDDDLFRTAYLTKEPLDGARLPGGLDAETDVRVEHRRGKQHASLRDESTLCRVFLAPPATIAATRRRLGLLRDEDRRRAAEDIVSYAVGLAFGRWDLRLFQHPAWIPRWADPFDPLPPCPLGQLVNGEGLPATGDRIASEAWLVARRHPTELPREDEVRLVETPDALYPLTLPWNGLLCDDSLHPDPREGFLARFEAALEALFGARRPDWTADLEEALGVRSLADYLRGPHGFFKDHLSATSKSRRVAPIFWPLSTPSGGLCWWLYAPRMGSQTLPFLVNRIRDALGDLRAEADRLRPRAESDGKALAQLRALQAEIAERQEMHDRLSALEAQGYRPQHDDGFVVTASPLHFAFRNAKWRSLLEEHWRKLQAGDLDWSHLAMIFRPEQVKKKCETDLSLAIAHGLEELHQAPPATKRGGGRSKKAPDPQGSQGTLGFLAPTETDDD